MNESLSNLATRIYSELRDLRQVVERAQQVWQRFESLSDDSYVDSAALNLHGFYSGLERLFELIADIVDRSKPTGAEWHRELLQQMSTEIPTIRPAVISENTRIQLEEYLRFRHLVRNVYTFKLNAEKMSQLVENAPNLYQRVNRELSTFADFLKQRSKED